MKNIFKHNVALMGNIILVGLMLLFFGCTKPQVKGIVVDNSNKPIQNAEIRIQGTQFKGLTDNAGRYSIQYVPGKLQILFEKNGYTKKNMMIDVATEAEYPADTIRLIKFPGEQEVSEIVASNKVQTKSIYIENILYHYGNRPGENILGSTGQEAIELINSYKPLQDKGLISIKEYDGGVDKSNFLKDVYKKYFIISLTEQGEKFSVGGKYITKAPCENCLNNWVVNEEKYYAINVQVCEIVFDKIEKTTNDYENNTSQIEYVVKTKNTTPWGSFFAIADGQNNNRKIYFSLSENNRWNYRYY